MNNLVFLLWFGNVFFDTVGQLAFKAAAVTPRQLEGENSGGKAENSITSYWYGLLKRPTLWLGIFAYIAEFLLWLAFLTMVPLSEGVLLGSVNIIVIMILGRIFFHETLSPLRVIGIGMVALGVAVVGLF